MKFKYEALDQEGNLRRGELEAADELSACEILRKKGLFPVELKTASRLRLRLTRGEKLSDLILFTQQLHRLLRAGLPLDRALKLLQKIFQSAGKDELAGLIEAVSRDLSAGEDFASALAKHPFFPAYYVNLVRAGQSAGALPRVLEELSAYLVNRKRFQEELISALLYPSFLLVFGLFAVQTVLVYVLPRFGRIFEDLGVEPPAFTRLLLAVGLFWREWGPFVILALLGLGVWLRFRFRGPEGRARLERFLLRMPALGRYLLLADLVRVFRGLAVMLRGGVPVERALGMAASVAGLNYVKELLERAREDIKHGAPLSGAFQALPRRVHFIYDLIVVGEETGDLAQAFADAADITEEEIQNVTKRFLTILEPAAILFFGMVLGSMIISILVAIFDLRI